MAAVKERRPAPYLVSEPLVLGAAFESVRVVVAFVTSMPLPVDAVSCHGRSIVVPVPVYCNTPPPSVGSINAQGFAVTCCMAFTIVSLAIYNLRQTSWLGITRRWRSITRAH